MSADTKQTTLGDGDPPHIEQRDHLVPNAPGDSTLEANVERKEAWCDECSNRVTVGSREWGHETTCAHYCWRDE